MKPRHVAIFTLMGNGHLYPVLPLCSELVSQGFRVSCPVSPRYAARIEATGADTVAFTELPVDYELRAENEARSRRVSGDVSRLDTSELEWSYLSRSIAHLLSQVLGFYERDPPDLVLYNRYCIPGRIVASRCRSRAVQLSPHFAYPGRSRFWENGTCENPRGLVAYAEKLDSLFAAHDVSSEDNLWHTEHLNIHFIPKEFQYRHDLFDQRFFFSGSLLNRRFESAWRVPEKGKPIVLISGYSGLPETKSSESHYFRLFIDALGKSACHCVLSIGDSVDPITLGPLPANFEINQRASHLAILPRAALLVCHGGMGSTLEALYNGVPVLAIPNSPYTEEVAHRITDLRVGAILPRGDLHASSIADAVEEMICDEALHERAKSVQRVFNRSGGARAAAQKVQQFLEES